LFPLNSKVMETATKEITKNFRVKATDLEPFSEFLHSVLPKEAKVSSYTLAETDVSITVPSRLQKVFKKIRTHGLLI
jgi:hypothetical protein